MPNSMARATARCWSVAAPFTIKPPTAPQPKLSTESLRPVFPKVRVSIILLIQISPRSHEGHEEGQMTELYLTTVRNCGPTNIETHFNILGCLSHFFRFSS